MKSEFYISESWKNMTLREKALYLIDKRDKNRKLKNESKNTK